MPQITQASDLLPLAEIIKGMMDKCCWQASLASGNQLRLYLGTRVSSSNESESNEQEEWIFSSQTTSWKLESMNQAMSLYEEEDGLGLIEFGHQTITTSQENAASINEKIRGLERTYPIHFELPHPPTFNFSLTFDPLPSRLTFDLQPELTFSLKYRLTLMPDLEESDLAYWELITPNQMLLKFGPGIAWSYTALRR
jgi:hypothetical protein